MAIAFSRVLSTARGGGREGVAILGEGCFWNWPFKCVSWLVDGGFILVLVVVFVLVVMVMCECEV